MEYRVTFDIKKDILKRAKGDFIEIGMHIETSIFMIFGFYESSLNYDDEVNNNKVTNAKIIMTFKDHNEIPILQIKDKMIQLFNFYGDNVEFSN